MLGRSVDWYAAEFLVDDDATAMDRRLVLVPVGRFDLRAMRAVEQAWHVPARERRALHVVTDEHGAHELADEWMRRDLAFPLHFVEDDGGVAATVARVVRMELAAEFSEVIVLVGRLALLGPLDRLLHDRTADAISRLVHRMPAVQIGLVNVAPR